MPQLGYWAIRGLAQCIRTLLHHVGEEYEDVNYYDSNIDEWLGKKFTLGLEFPNLPYYIDDNVKLSQSIAILKYLSRKYKIDVTTDKDRMRLDLLTEEFNDIRLAVGRLVYDKNFANLKDKFLENTKVKIQQLETSLADRPYFMGDKITYVDFLIYEPLDQMRAIFENYLEPYPKLRAFMERFENLPNIKKYMDTDEYKKRPFNGSFAAFNYSKIPA